MIIKNTFDKGPENWCSYEYHWSIVAKGRNIFILNTWESEGGVDDSGYVWCDESRWSADTPESPVSLLPFITYNHWAGRSPLADLREARVSVYLRGDGLKLFGARCYFWVMGDGCRWHFTSRPLSISDDKWAKAPEVFVLKNDESLWHLSWSSDPANPPPLRKPLTRAQSYGFSLVGFGQEPRGKFSMDEFELRLKERK